MESSEEYSVVLQQAQDPNTGEVFLFIQGENGETIQVENLAFDVAQDGTGENNGQGNYVIMATAEDGSVPTEISLADVNLASSGVTSGIPAMIPVQSDVILASSIDYAQVAKSSNEIYSTDTSATPATASLPAPTTTMQSVVIPTSSTGSTQVSKPSLNKKLLLDNSSAPTSSPIIPVQPDISRTPSNDYSKPSRMSIPKSTDSSLLADTVAGQSQLAASRRTYSKKSNIVWINPEPANQSASPATSKITDEKKSETKDEAKQDDVALPQSSPTRRKTPVIESKKATEKITPNGSESNIIGSLSPTRIPKKSHKSSESLMEKPSDPRTSPRKNLELQKFESIVAQSQPTEKEKPDPGSPSKDKTPKDNPKTASSESKAYNFRKSAPASGQPSEPSTVTVEKSLSVITDKSKEELDDSQSKRKRGRPKKLTDSETELNEDQNSSSEPSESPKKRATSEPTIDKPLKNIPISTPSVTNDKTTADQVNTQLSNQFAKRILKKKPESKIVEKTDEVTKSDASVSRRKTGPTESKESAEKTAINEDDDKSSLLPSKIPKKSQKASESLIDKTADPKPTPRETRKSHSEVPAIDSKIGETDTKEAEVQPKDKKFSDSSKTTTSTTPQTKSYSFRKSTPAPPQSTNPLLLTADKAKKEPSEVVSQPRRGRSKMLSEADAEIEDEQIDSSDNSEASKKKNNLEPEKGKKASTPSVTPIPPKNTYIPSSKPSISSVTPSDKSTTESSESQSRKRRGRPKKSQSDIEIDEIQTHQQSTATAKKRVCFDLDKSKKLSDNGDLPSSSKSTAISTPSSLKGADRFTKKLDSSTSPFCSSLLTPILKSSVKSSTSGSGRIVVNYGSPISEQQEDELRKTMVNQLQDMRSPKECYDFQSNGAFFHVRHQSSNLTSFTPRGSTGNYVCPKCGYQTARMNNLVLHHKDQCPVVRLHWQNEINRQAKKSFEKSSTELISSVKKFKYDDALNNEDSQEEEDHDFIAAHRKKLNEKSYDPLSSPIVTSSVFHSDPEDDEQDNIDKTKKMFGFAENDVVWTKWSDVHWPALVVNVDDKDKMVSLRMIDNPSNKKCLTISIDQVLTFNEAERNKKFLREGKAVIGDSLVKAVQKAEDYSRKLCLGDESGAAKLFGSMEAHYDSPSEEEQLADHSMRQILNEEPYDFCRSMDNGDTNDSRLNDPESDGNDDYIGFQSSETLEQLKALRKIQNAKLFECIKEGKVESHLLGVYKETIPSDRHKKFKEGSAAERSQLSHVAWFGPVDDDDQQEEIYDYCSQLFKSNFKPEPIFDSVAYLFEVWVPEAIVKAISKTRMVDMAEAETIFTRGVIMSKSEKNQLQKEILKETELKAQNEEQCHKSPPFTSPTEPQDEPKPQTLESEPKEKTELEEKSEAIEKSEPVENSISSSEPQIAEPNPESAPENVPENNLNDKLSDQIVVENVDQPADCKADEPSLEEPKSTVEPAATETEKADKTS